MRVLSTKVHSVADYLLALLLIVLPFILGYGKTSAQTGVMVLLGGATVAYSLITGYEGGIVKILSMKAHLAIDIASGVFLTASPWIFGFNDRVYLPYVIIGIAEIMVSLITRTTPESMPTDSGGRTHTGAGANEVFKPERLSSKKQNIVEGL